MLHRRELLSSTGFVGLVGAFLPGKEGPVEQASDRSVENVAQAIDRLRTEFQTQRTFQELAVIREPLRVFLRANGKYPDFIDVGVDVWQAAYDWHVRWKQPITVGRDTAGRYTFPLMQTTIVVLRADQPAGFVGVPYDK